MMREKVVCTLRCSASSSGDGHDHVGRLGDARDQVGLGGDVVADLHPLGAVHEDAQRAVGHLEHARHHARHADVVELVGPGLLAGALARRRPSPASGCRRARR